MRTKARLPALLDVRKKIEELARLHLESQLNGKTPAMSADTKADWEREIWKLNQLDGSVRPDFCCR